MGKLFVVAQLLLSKVAGDAFEPSTTWSQETQGDHASQRQSVHFSAINRMFQPPVNRLLLLIQFDERAQE